MLVSHLVPTQMRWQSRLFNDFDYMNYDPDEYIHDSDSLNRLIVVEDGIKHNLKHNVFNIIRDGDFSKALSRASDVKQPLIVLSGDPDESWQAFKETKFNDLGISFDAFIDFKRGANDLEKQMFARFSFISKHKREIIKSNKRIWLMGFTQPHEVKRYGQEVYACINDVVVKEALWRIKLKDEFYTNLHEEFPEDPTVPLGVYESIMKFNSWARN